MLEFVYPNYLWLLLAVPVLMLFWGAGLWHHRRMRKRFGNLENMEEISRVSWSGRGWMRGAAFALSIMGMILGLAYPQVVGRELRPVPMPTDVVFMLDVSPSMFCRDMDPNRIGRAEQIIEQFILHKQANDRYSLIAFNMNSVVLSYLTKDPQSSLLYFDYINQTEEPGLGTSMGAALISGVRVIQADDAIYPQNAKTRRRLMVLISDGDDNIGQWEEPLGEVIRRHLHVYTFGLGTATGAPVPLVMKGKEIIKYATLLTGERLISKAEQRTLREVAERTQAHFYRGEDDNQVARAIDDILVNGRPLAGFRSDPVRQDLFFYFLAVSFVCMLAGIFM